MPGVSSQLLTAFNNTEAFFDVGIGAEKAGRVTFELFDDKVPKTVQNFKTIIDNQLNCNRCMHKGSASVQTPYYVYRMTGRY